MEWYTPQWPLSTGYGTRVLVKIFSKDVLLLEYTLKDVFNQKCISIQLNKDDIALIYDKNYYDSIMNPKLTYVKPKLVFSVLINRLYTIF